MNIRPTSILQALTDLRLPGGCDDCDAFQVISREPSERWGGVYVLTVHHDISCPDLSHISEPPC